MTHIIQTTNERQRLPLSLKLIYTVGNFGFTILISIVGFFLLIFYTDVALVPPALASSALLVSKIWDTINDPLFGWLSDRTHSRFGRRRVYLIFGALPLALATVLLWSMPRGLPDVWAFAWIAVTYIVFDTFFTITSVPFSALAAEITPDYDERTSLAAFSGIGAVVGYMVGSVATRIITSRFEDASLGYTVAGAIFGTIVGLCVALVAWKVREPVEFQVKTSEMPVLASIRATFRNRPFNILMVAFGLVRLSFTLLQTMLAYFVTYQLRSPECLTLILAILMVMVGLCIWFWKWISDRWSKGIAYALGLGIAALAVVSTFFLQPGQEGVMYLVVAVMGLGLSTHWVIPWAMLPDVVEYDEAVTGQRREGMYYGVYGLVDKITRTVGIFAIGWVLQLFGYVANVEQTARSLFGIRLFFGPVSAVLLLLAVPVLLSYPITRASHASLRRKLGKETADATQPGDEV